MNRHYAAVFRSASVPYRIKYLKRKVKSTETSKVLERATRFPLCTLDIFRRLVSTYSPTPKPSFPIARRFFKHLSADSPSADLPYIGALLDFGADVNAHQGFAVYSAVNASNYELLELLYTNTIDPNLSQGVALKTAIKRKDKDMVEYILEASRDKEKLNLPIKKSVKTDALRIAAQGASKAAQSNRVSDTGYRRRRMGHL